MKYFYTCEVTCNDLQKLTRDRNTYQQSVKCKNIKNGQTGDQGGHLIGSQFEGAGEQINLVPMKSSINQPPGTYATMEQEWANTITNGGSVKDVFIDIKYENPNLPNRPTRIIVQARINNSSSLTTWTHINY